MLSQEQVMLPRGVPDAPEPIEACAVAAGRDLEIPVSSGQARLWLLHNCQEGKSRCNVSITLRAPPDLAAVEAALADLIARHEILRTIFTEDAHGVHQRILPPGMAAPLLTRLEAMRDQEDEVIARFVNRPFNLTGEIPLRACCWRRGAQKQVILLVLHHIALDAWSIRTLTSDLVRAYAARQGGQAPRWAPTPPIQYRDYCLWQRQAPKRRLSGARYHLASVPLRNSGEIQFIRSGIDRQAHQTLSGIAKGASTNLSVVLHAVVVLLLARAFGIGEVAIGIPFSGRVRPALRHSVGIFERLAVFRTDTAADIAFRALVAQIRDKDAELSEYRNEPFADWLESLDAIVTLQDSAATTSDIPGFSTNLIPGSSYRGFYKLLFSFVEFRRPGGAPAGMQCVVEYDSAEFRPAQIEALLDGLFRLAKDVGANSQLRVDSFPQVDLSEKETRGGPRRSAESVVSPLPFEQISGTDSAPSGYYVPARSTLQDQILHIWEQFFDVHPIGVADDFLDLGGDPVIALEIVKAVEHLSGVRLSLAFDAPGVTIQAIAGILLESLPLSPVIRIQPGGGTMKPPLFFLHGDFNGGGIYGSELARALGSDQPLYVLPPHGINGCPVPATIEEMAGELLRHVRKVAPQGPYYLGGYCAGGIVALEMARQLRLEHERLSLILVEPPCTNVGEPPPANAAPPNKTARSNVVPTTGDSLFERYVAVMRTYRPEPYRGPAHVLWASQQARPQEVLSATHRLLPDLSTHEIPGTHTTCFGRYVRETAAEIKRCFAQAC